MAILGDTVLLWAEETQEFLKGFSIPKVSTGGTGLCLPKFAAPCLDSGEQITMLYTSDWAQPSASPGSFALAADVSGDLQLQLYQMVDLAPLSNRLLPAAIPMKVGDITLESWESPIGGPNLHPLASDFAMIGLSHGELMVAKIAMPESPHQELPDPCTKALTDDTLYEEHDVVEEVSMCVATGRLITTNVLYEDGDGIRVIDYLSMA